MLSPPRLLAVLAGLALLASGGVLGAAQYATLSGYESTTGTVERAQVEMIPNKVFRGNLTSETLFDTDLYAPNVSYTYTVDGETYTAENVAPGTDMVMGDRDRLVAALGSVHTGARTVRYHPDDPADAYLLKRLAFFPAGVLALCGLLVIADGLTPRARTLRLVTAWVPLDTLARLPGFDVATAADAADDPMAILSAKRTWAGIDPAPFRGTAGTAVWLLCYLGITDLVLAYVVVSSPPYDLWVAGAAGVVAVGLARLWFSRVLD